MQGGWYTEIRNAILLDKCSKIPILFLHVIVVIILIRHMCYFFVNQTNDEVTLRQVHVSDFFQLFDNDWKLSVN